MSFLYLSCSVATIMDSPNGEFNSYKSKRLATSSQTRKNIAIARFQNSIYLMNTIM